MIDLPGLNPYPFLFFHLRLRLTSFGHVLKIAGAGSMILGSCPSSAASASLSFSSSIAAYTGSAKTFSIGEIEKATNNFDAATILGEGGFGLVYRGTLEDGTKVAVKLLKRDDQQGSREFLAEVEMLSRLHHRNLVKLIGICTEEHCRCLVYELIPNGSVDSHLHGIKYKPEYIFSCMLANITSSHATDFHTS